MREQQQIPETVTTSVKEIKAAVGNPGPRTPSGGELHWGPTGWRADEEATAPRWVGKWGEFVFLSEGEDKAARHRKGEGWGRKRPGHVCAE